MNENSYRKWAKESEEEASRAEVAGDYHTARMRYSLAANFYEAAARTEVDPELARTAARCWYAMGSCADRLGNRADALADELDAGGH